MPEDLHWNTYTGRQAEQVIGGLQVLIDGNVLSKGKEGEEELAKKIQRRLRGAVTKGKSEISMVALTGKEEDLVNQVEAVLWR